MVEQIINTFPEPFKSALGVVGFSFDFKLNEGKSDHEYLEKQGYEIYMGGDCSYYIKGLKNLSPTSYGDWGSIYSDLFKEETKDGFYKSFYVFCKMYEEGIVKLWRIGFYLNSVRYQYDDDTKIWEKYEDGKWTIIKNPLNKILSSTI